jgi:acetyl-CoA carboxylase biotin carboxyl carrier protein
MTFENIKELIKLFSESNIANLKIKDGEVSVSLDKNSKPEVKTQEVVTKVEPKVEAEVKETQTTSTSNSSSNENATFITSPMVGTFYKAPSPESPSFVEVGDVVRKGQKICILEAMKIMNELEAEFDCKILEILVENTSAVEYDMPLFKVEKL